MCVALISWNFISHLRCVLRPQRVLMPCCVRSFCVAGCDHSACRCPVGCDCRALQALIRLWWDWQTRQTDGRTDSSKQFIQLLQNSSDLKISRVISTRSSRFSWKMHGKGYDSRQAFTLTSDWQDLSTLLNFWPCINSSRLSIQIVSTQHCQVIA